MLFGDISARQGGGGPSYPITIDSFEDGDLAGWSGDTGGWETHTSYASDGTYGIHTTASDGYYQIQSYPGDGLNYYPSAGERIEYEYYNEYPAGHHYFMWAVQGTHQFYYVRVDAQDSQFELGKKDSQWTVNDSATPSLPEHAEFTIIVEWASDGKMEAWVQDSSGNLLGNLLSQTDTQWTSGGVAFGSNNIYQHLDYPRVTASV